MIKVILIALLVLGDSVAVLALDKGFEYLGIRSGMKKEEISKLLDLHSEEMFEQGTITGEKTNLKDKALWALSFSYTDQGALWRLDIYFPQPDDPAKHIAFEKALKQRFLAPTISEGTSTGEYGPKHYYRVTLVDQTLLDQAVGRYVKEYLSRM
jgi:hypothetical protein